MTELSIEAEIRKQYVALRALTLTVNQNVVLHIGHKQTAVAVGNLSDLEAILVLEIGSKITAHDYFKHTPPTPFELENAIVHVEDEVARVRSLISGGSVLYTTDAALREIAILSGIKVSSKMVLSLEAMEQCFDRMAAIALGMPASQTNLPASAEFAATLLILREFMHHLQFSKITCIG